MRETQTIRLSGVEALRGLAASAVVLFHAARHVNKAYGAPALITWFQAGHAGVDLFFVISGFIILFVHWPDLGRPGRLPHYVSRRFTRVMPLYWVGLVLTMLMIAAGRHGMPGFGRLAWSASLLPSAQEPLLGIAWTLQFELVFYVAFAALIVSRAGGAALMAGWLAVIVVVAVTGRPGVVPPPLCGVFAVEFFFGMAVGGVLRVGRVSVPRVLAGVGAVLFVAALVAESLGAFDGFGTWARVIYGVPAAVLVAGLAGAERAGRPIRMAGLSRLGRASYSIYLFQFVFIGALWQALLVTGVAPQLPHVVLFALLAAAALGGGLAMGRLVEQPLLRLFRARGARLRTA